MLLWFLKTQLYLFNGYLFNNLLNSKTVAFISPFYLFQWAVSSQLGFCLIILSEDFLISPKWLWVSEENIKYKKTVEIP